MLSNFEIGPRSRDLGVPQPMHQGMVYLQRFPKSWKTPAQKGLKILKKSGGTQEEGSTHNSFNFDELAVNGYF